MGKRAGWPHNLVRSNDHRAFSPSQIDRYKACPGSARLCNAAPARPSSKWAQEGTDAHELLSLAIKCGSVSTAWGQHPKFKDRAPDSVTVDAVQLALDYIRELASSSPGAVLYSEVLVDPPIASCPGQAAGTCDIAIWLPTQGHLHVYDYKHGAGVTVEVEGNEQTLGYSAGFAFGGTIPTQLIRRVTHGIIQPRAPHADGVIRTEEVSLLDLQYSLLDLDIAIAKCLEPNAPLVPGAKQCRWCDARTMCPEYESKSLAAVRQEFSVVSDVQAAGLPTVADMPVDRLGAVLRQAPLLLGWIKACVEHANELARTGYTIPGQKLVQTSSRREWYESHTKVANNLADILECDLGKVMPRKLITITEAERLVVAMAKSKVRGTKAKKAAAEDALQTLAFLTVKNNSGNLVLVPEDDKRLAVSVGAAFNNVKLP